MNRQPWVAIVDDDASVRSSVSRLLRCVGIASSAFGSAEEYLGRTRQGEPTCLLLDVHLGAGMSGFELQERLDSDGVPTPIIFMTGRPEVDFSALRRNGEAVELLRKPLEMSRLFELLHRVVEPKVGSIPP